jgi:hypothetical protein
MSTNISRAEFNTPPMAADELTRAIALFTIENSPVFTAADKRKAR